MNKFACSEKLYYLCRRIHSGISVSQYRCNTVKVKTFCLAYVKSFVSALENGGGVFVL